MASSQHRPGATVKLSPAAYSKDKMKQVEDLESRLLSLPAKKNDDQASRLRMKLCEHVSDIILTDPLFSSKHDCIGRLWRSCFYSPIGQLRQRISREKKKKDSPNLAKLQKSLGHFISEAITLYDYLISQYHKKLLPAASMMTPASQQSTQSMSQSSLNNDSQQATSEDPSGVVPGLFRMYIHEGDLYRYDSKYKEAQECYGKASKLSPGRGNPYNQIAVVAQLKDAAAPLNAVALYWYARSLLTTHEPFEISKANLARLFQSNRDWFHKQPPPPEEILRPADGNGGREMVKAQRSVASRHFLSQFVDLHFSFFQGIAAATSGGDNKEKKKNPSDEQVVKQMEAAQTPLSVLLRNSAFGGPLICKMVAICAFSEAYRPEENEKIDSVATAMLARIFTLMVGTCLAERATVGLAKIKDQPEKMGNPGKAPSSVRLLLPLLLVCEYVESSPINVDVRRNGSDLSPLAREVCEKAVDNFWLQFINVMNLLTNLRGPLNLNNEDWQNSSLKEFSTLVGYSPFQTFLKDTMASKREDGYASVEEAASVLELASTQESATQQSCTQDSTTGGSNSVEEYKVKVARLLAFGDRMADSIDSTTLPGRRFGRNSDGSYVWNEDAVADDNDDPMMDVENVHDNDTQPPLAGKTGDKGGDVLVYSVPQGGGPALLVPGMLLQNRATGGTGDLAEQKPRASSDGSMNSPVLPFGSSPAHPQPAPAMGMAVDPHVGQQPPAAPPASVMPPPGFGGGGLSAMPQGHVAVPQGHLPMGGNLGMPSYSPLMPPTQRNAALPPGFAQGLHPGMQQPQQSYQPTVASSMHLFGGPEALKTANPFAAASMPSLDANGNMPMMGLNFGAAGNANGNGASFLSPASSSGVAESTLLGSGLLNSLFEDSGDKETKNPFAT